MLLNENAQALGRVVGDFRGVLTGEIRKDDQKKEGGVAEQQKFDPTFRGPFSRGAMERNLEHDYAPPPAGWALRVIRKQLGYVVSPSQLIEYEFTASGFLGGRVVYVSALSPDGSDAHPWQPVCFYMHSRTDDPWELGRLVDTITTLGELRIAAVYDFQKLQEKNSSLSKLQKEISAVSRSLEQKIRDAAQEYNPYADLIEDDEPAESSLAENIKNLGDDFERIDASVESGVRARVLRSNYYMNRFATVKEALEETEVRGYQPYSTFISRRLGPAFNFLRMISGRLDFMDSAMEDVIDRFTAYKMTEVTHNIRNITTRIQHEDDRMKGIQEFGERILVIVLIPYYASHVMGGLLAPVITSAASETKEESPIFWSIGALIGLLIMFSRLIFSIFNILKKRRDVIKNIYVESKRDGKRTSKKGTDAIKKSDAELRDELIWVGGVVIGLILVCFSLSTQVQTVRSVFSFGGNNHPAAPAKESGAKLPIQTLSILPQQQQQNLQPNVSRPHPKAYSPSIQKRKVGQN